MEEGRKSQEQKEETFAEWEKRINAIFDKLFDALVELRRLEKGGRV